MNQPGEITAVLPQSITDQCLKMNKPQSFREYLRPLFNTLLERITNTASNSTCLCFLNEFIIHTFMHIGAGAGAATLPLQRSQHISNVSNVLDNRIQPTEPVGKLIAQVTNLIKEQSKMGKLHGLVNVSVLTNNEWRLPAQLQCHRL